MSMSDHERALLVTGTLDTSGVGGSPYAELNQVAVAFGAQVHEGGHISEEVPVKGVSEPEQKAAENSPSEPVEEPEPVETEPVEEPEAEKPEAEVTEPVKAPAHRAKRAPAKKAQASAPADE